jgi:hypothetical protein
VRELELTICHLHTEEAGGQWNKLLIKQQDAQKQELHENQGHTRTWPSRTQKKREASSATDGESGHRHEIEELQNLKLSDLLLLQFPCGSETPDSNQTVVEQAQLET